MPGWFNVKSDWKKDENGNPVKQRKIKNGDTIMILVEEIHIGDNKEWLKAGKINISLRFETKNVNYDKSLGTFTDVREHSDLSIGNVVVLPPTKIEDYITITVNAMELDTAEGLLSKIPNMLENTKGIVANLPIPEAMTSMPFDLLGNAMNMAAALNEDDVIIKKQVSFFVDEKYPNLPSERYFYEGSFDFASEEEDDESKCSHIILKFIKPKEEKKS